MIRIENLSVSYKETLALKDISLVSRTNDYRNYWSKWCWKINFIKGMLGIIHMKVRIDDKEVEIFTSRVAYVSSKSISTTISLSGQGMCLTGTPGHLSRFFTL